MHELYYVGCSEGCCCCLPSHQVRQRTWVVEIWRIGRFCNSDKGKFAYPALGIVWTLSLGLPLRQQLLVVRGELEAHKDQVQALHLIFEMLVSRFRIGD